MTQGTKDAIADAETLRLNADLPHVQYPPLPLERWRVIEAARNAFRAVPGLRG